MKVDISQMDIRQRIIDEARQGDFTLFEKLGRDLGVELEDLGISTVTVNVSLTVTSTLFQDEKLTERLKDVCYETISCNDHLIEQMFYGVGSDYAFMDSEETILLEEKLYKDFNKTAKVTAELVRNE